MKALSITFAFLARWTLCPAGFHDEIPLYTRRLVRGERRRYSVPKGDAALVTATWCSRCRRMLWQDTRPRGGA